MANIQTLTANVQKATEKVTKCKATIVRHEKALAKKIATLEKVSGRTVDTNNLDAYKWDENHKSYDYYWEACEVSSKLSDIKGATKKLAEAERILEGHQAKLDKETEKDEYISNSVPQVIKDFLNAWKDLAYGWSVNRYNDFLVFKRDLYAQEKEALKECSHMSWRAKREFMEEKGLNNIERRLLNFAGATVMQMATYRNEEERLAFLDKVLEEEKKAKTIDLINRITEVVGDIVDASKLSVSAKGNLDGIINGTKADAEIKTIGAGGYNIQCFHYRTLINKLK